jgi:hypothetical protein
VSQNSRASSAEEFFSRLSPRSSHKEEPRARSRPAKTILNLRDTDGSILRSYRTSMMRHFLRKGVPVRARELLGRLVSGDCRPKLGNNGLRGG